MKAKDLWEKEMDNSRIDGNRLYPNNDIRIKGKKVLYIEKKYEKYTIFLGDEKNLHHLNYSIYGTPEESLTYKFALANRRDFGLIEHITDKDYVVNSYHVDPREIIDCFKKLEIEGKYLSLSQGGAVSYVETNDLRKNTEAIVAIFQWMYHNISYAEINWKIGICHECGFNGEMPLLRTDDGNFVFKCPECGNTDDDKMDVTGRLCGYIGTINAGNTNKGRLFDIYSRTIHTDCKEDL